MKVILFFITAVMLAGVIVFVVVITHTRRPWIAESAALQIACPLLGDNSPGDLAMQCAIYSRFGVIWDNPGTEGGTCPSGSHLETSRLEGRSCIPNGYHSVGGGRTCQDLFHLEGDDRCHQDMCAEGSHPVGGNQCCSNGWHRSETNATKCERDTAAAPRARTASECLEREHWDGAKCTAF